MYGEQTGRAVFLDRDGTLGGDGGFCHPDEFILFPEAYDAIKLLNISGFSAVVITNQQRIGTGQITLAEVDASFDRIQAELALRGAHLDKWYVCPHRAQEGCICRKPSPYLLRKAALDLGLDLQASYMVGDVGASDILAGTAAGCHTVLVLTGRGKGSLGKYRSLWSQVEPDYVAANVLDAVQYITCLGGHT